MAKTSASSATAYLPASEFLKRVDVRIVAQLCSDDRTPVNTSGNPPVVDVTGLATNVNLLACINDACGDLEAAAFIGEMYKAEDLQALTGMSLAKLYRILTDLTFCYLMERRPELQVTKPETFDRSVAWLDLLAQGKRIFAFTETAAAGLMEIQHESTADVDNRQGITWITRDFFGRRANRWPGS